MSSVQTARPEGERPPRYEVLVAAIAVGYGAGYSVGTGSGTEQALGAVAMVAISWLWGKWHR
ncbi:hypothetical protein M1P56_32690 [Streptomyces sp. HU2014]|uniref:hypothetical protein n=1 Tax=Streptomyces sp. HU2014 TaxID=2939414 RepID=UPI00200E9900|nr:hypothetical protein [Streptomyces sp. HU2014]UQI48734.1 hypothetical protein M1P56_32690 [Streptomyces sp. HU2014]